MRLRLEIDVSSFAPDRRSPKIAHFLKQTTSRPILPGFQVSVIPSKQETRGTNVTILNEDQYTVVFIYKCRDTCTVHGIELTYTWRKNSCVEEKQMPSFHLANKHTRKNSTLSFRHTTIHRQWQKHPNGQIVWKSMSLNLLLRSKIWHICHSFNPHWFASKKKSLPIYKKNTPKLTKFTSQTCCGWETKKPNKNDLPTFRNRNRSFRPTCSRDNHSRMKRLKLHHFATKAKETLPLLAT